MCNMFSEVQERVKKRVIFFFLLLLILIISSPVFMYGLDGTQGQDLNFHLVRIENIAEGLKNNEFPVRMGSAFYTGYGYPISIFYGDIFLYLPAVLRLVGIPVLIAYKIYVFIINALSVIIGYLCYKAIFKKRWIAGAVDLLYMTSTYRLLNLYIRSSAGEFTAMLFLPIVFYSIYSIYTNDNNCVKNNVRYIVTLSIGMAGIVVSHILTVEMVCVLIFLFAIINWKKTLKKNVFLSLFFAAILCLLASAFFVVPFLDYMKKVDIVGSSILTSEGGVQWRGVYIGQLFAFNQIPFGHSSLDVTERMNLTLGFPMMAAFFGGTLLWLSGVANKNIKVLLSFSLLSLFMATNLFPWDWITRIPIIGWILGQIQYPWRYLGMAMLFISILFGASLRLISVEKKHKVYVKEILCVTMILCILNASNFFSYYCNYASIVNYQDSSELSYDGTSNYLMKNVDNSNLRYTFETSENCIVEIVNHESVNYTISCKNGSNESEIVAPLFNYPYFHVIDSNGMEFSIEESSNRQVAFIVPSDYEGIIYIYWKEPMMWRIAEVISIMTWGGIFIGCIYRNLKLKDTREG